MAQITLYGPREVPFVLKVELALVLKKLDFALEVPRGPEDYKRWSPETGLLPVIDVDGTRVHDSSAILDFLDERFPEPPLLSSDPKLASSQRTLETWAEQTFTFYWMTHLRTLVRSTPFHPGEIIPFRGSDHVICHSGKSRGVVTLADGEIIVSGAEEHFARRLSDWLKQQARDELSARARYYAAALDRPVGRVTVRDTKSRWGSCNAKGDLSFCWRLILAPEQVLDYVAAHEAAHLVEHSHSKNFWAIVKQLRPDYRDAERWLKTRGSSLHRYG